MSNLLQHSNLFRQPTIPSFDDVHRNFLSRGGTKEMAEAFYNKWSAVGWFMNGSPIVNYAALISNFIHCWNKNNSKPKDNISAIEKW